MANMGAEGSGNLGSADGERIICVIARDVLPLDSRESGAVPFVTRAWKGRWLILAFVVGFALVSLVYAFLATEWYEAEVLLAPAGTKNTRGLGNALGSLASLGGGLGSLAEFAGINIGGSSTSEPLGVLKSREFAREFIEELGLLHVLLADKWDAHAGRWKQTNPKKQPDVRDAVKYFDKHVLRVEEDKKTGLVAVIIRWKNADVAALWANTIVDRLNAQMRARELAEAEANVDYLRNELAQTNVVAVQQAVSKLLETEMQKVMVARGNKQFAFRVVDPAAVPKWRSEPKRTLVVALAILAGGLAGLIAVFVRDSYRGRGLGGVA
jgi:uncharacterized protein involved in exopolysaccharide biosynthesis